MRRAGVVLRSSCSVGKARSAGSCTRSATVRPERRVGELCRRDRGHMYSDPEGDLIEPQVPQWSYTPCRRVRCAGSVGVLHAGGVGREGQVLTDRSRDPVARGGEPGPRTQARRRDRPSSVIAAPSASALAQACPPSRLPRSCPVTCSMRSSTQVSMLGERVSDGAEATLKRARRVVALVGGEVRSPHHLAGDVVPAVPRDQPPALRRRPRCSAGSAAKPCEAGVQADVRVDIHAVGALHGIERTVERPVALRDGPRAAAPVPAVTVGARELRRSRRARVWR